MEQTSSSSYPNVLVVDYLKTARRANPEQMMKSMEYLNVGYQKILTFQTQDGGFGWWAGANEPVLWVTGYGVQQLVDASRVTDVDRRVIDRAVAWMISKQAADGSWQGAGATHGEAIDGFRGTHVPLTAYVAWTLADAGTRGGPVAKAVKYIKDHLDEVEGNVYGLALAAMALAAADPKSQDAADLIARLDDRKVEEKDHAYWRLDGQTFCYARGDAGNVEATALIAQAMMRVGGFTPTVNKALGYLVRARQGGGAWGSTQATILALKALVRGMSGTPQKGTVRIRADVNGVDRAIEVTEDQADVLQLVDFKEATRGGQNEIVIRVEGSSTMMVQIVGRHYVPWSAITDKEEKKPIDVSVAYDRTKLAKNDLLDARVRLAYNGDVSTYMVIVDLGLPPGFELDASSFEKLVERGELMKFTVTPKQATLYFGKMAPGQVMEFGYALRAKVPIKAKTPQTHAYEYYTPANRDVAAPVEIEVTE
ncbi:MAG: hypothetical protein HYY16_08585 [Planctomycetes bacterium]|nr:hypothetical protein [Planctomycetota bacterium]